MILIPIPLIVQTTCNNSTKLRYPVLLARTGECVARRLTSAVKTSSRFSCTEQVIFNQADTCKLCGLFVSCFERDRD